VKEAMMADMKNSRKEIDLSVKLRIQEAIKDLPKPERVKEIVYMPAPYVEPEPPVLAMAMPPPPMEVSTPKRDKRAELRSDFLVSSLNISPPEPAPIELLPEKTWEDEKLSDNSFESVASKMPKSQAESLMPKS
jgi:hypothetical protein